MLQAIGLSSRPRHGRPPAVRELSFEARPGQVTALLGPGGAGKSTVLRLLLGLEPGRGVTCFQGGPLDRAALPAREVGALLGDVPGHPARTVRGQLRMLGAAVGAPPGRADEVLRAVGLAALADRRLDALSLGMDRRLGIGCALLADPRTLLLDEPFRGLPPGERAWWYGLLRAHAGRGGTVLCTTAEPKEAARFADRVLAIDAGRLVADQDAAVFSRARLRPRVAVRTPHAARLAELIHREARAGRRGVEAVAEGGGLLSVYGSSCAEVGETAFRHRVLLHRLAEETGDAPPACAAPAAAPLPPRAPETPRPAPASADGRAPAPSVAAPSAAADASPAPADGPDPSAPAAAAGPAAATAGLSPALDAPAAPAEGPDPFAPVLDAPPARVAADSARTGGPGDGGGPPGPPRRSAPGSAVPSTRRGLRWAARRSGRPGARTARPAGRGPGPLVHGPVRPVRYEVLRMFGVRTVPLVMAGGVLASLLLCVLLGRSRATPPALALAGWPATLPLPPAVLAAGLIGALSFGDEHRFPALAPLRGPLSRRLALLAAKLLVTGGAAVLTALLALAAAIPALALVYGVGTEVLPAPGDRAALLVGWCALAVGSAWAGLLGAGIGRVTAAGFAAVLAVPVVVVPLVRDLVDVPGGSGAPGAPGDAGPRSAAGLPGRLHDLSRTALPERADDWLTSGTRLFAQPVGVALMLSLAVLICAYMVSDGRREAPRRP